MVLRNWDLVDGILFWMVDLDVNGLLDERSANNIMQSPGTIERIIAKAIMLEN